MNQDDLKRLRTIIHKYGWSDVMMTIGSLMAEQADKTAGDQSGALFASSSTMHALSDVWAGCGRFSYPNDMIEGQ